MLLLFWRIFLEEVWKPGSFTKNFSWGRNSNGLVELHSIIRAGFNDALEDVPRTEFRERIKKSGHTEYIPINFFLFNRTIAGVDMICADELVFQALSWDHSPAFDKVALFAFLFSYVGKWKKAAAYQRRPALWANAYVLERVASKYNWNTKSVTADDIQNFVQNDPRYKAETSRKLATNLNFLLHIGKVQDFGEKRPGRWWVDCLFLALDRLIEDSLIDGRTYRTSEYINLLSHSKFFELTGGENLEKQLATTHLIRLYTALGGRDRLSEDAVRDKILQEEPQFQSMRVNDSRPRGATHLTNPRILKSISPFCADLAKKAGFDVISPDEMDEMQAAEFIRGRTESALAVLNEKGIRPNMTIEELLKITRGGA
ncbi:hypothetical protein UF64_08105 [Thalassospira sp. HJ]|uniref:hypothetical protein n=1 Tax=Thalassospira sp. HJ TaxID=1616823 RepID=UPI0005CF00B5|nr:hypothetical protein [Thalassospira sp. HJ]KJE36034.1 hypothetical protein UF64_08105 [Thalassospira sp. HJ]